MYITGVIEYTKCGDNMKIDLHMHSHHSIDGEKSLLELIALAKDKGLDVIALTDHDKINGVSEMMALGEQHGIKVIPAIELQCLVDDHVTHILGYGIDPLTKLFDQRETEIMNIEHNSCAATVVTIKDYFQMDFDTETMIEKANSSMFSLVPVFEELYNNPRYLELPQLLPYRPGGNRSDLPLINFYWDYCVKGKPCYVCYPYPDYTQIFKEIKQAGGLVVLAHPNTTYYQNEVLLDQLIKAGLDGIECYSNYHTPQLNAWFHQYALNHQLLISGGSDYHGTYKPHIAMGEFGEPVDHQIFKPLIEKLLNKGQR